MSTDFTPAPKPAAPTLAPPRPPTPLWWRLAIAAGVLAVAALAYLLDPYVGVRGRAALGALSFVGLAFVFSADLRAIRWKTIAWGIVLQFVLAMVVRSDPGRAAFEFVGNGIKTLFGFAS